MPQHAHHHLLHLHSPSFTPGRLFWSILKSAMSSALNVSLGFLKVIVWQTDGAFRQINKSRSMSSVMCGSDWFLSPTEVSVRPSLCTQSRWILWAHTLTHTHTYEPLRKSWAVCVYVCVFATDGRAGHVKHARAHIVARIEARAREQTKVTHPLNLRSPQPLSLLMPELTEFIVRKRFLNSLMVGI